MRRADIIARLKPIEPDLRRIGVASLSLFGSHARDEAGDDSDIDVFIDPEDPSAFGFDPFMDAYAMIEGALAAKVDYGTRSGLHPLLRAAIERDAVRIF